MFMKITIECSDETAESAAKSLGHTKGDVGDFLSNNIARYISTQARYGYERDAMKSAVIDKDLTVTASNATKIGD